MHIIINVEICRKQEWFFLGKKGCVKSMDTMENENKVVRNLLIVLAVMAAIGMALWVLIRTERRLHRLLGILKGRLPRRRENRQFRIELEDI